MLNQPSLGGYKYLVTFIDEYTRYATVYPLLKKGEVFARWKTFKARVERLHGGKIKELRCDNGGEYIGKDMQDSLKDEGIVFHPSQPYAPQQNGIAERFNRTLFDKIRTQQQEGRIPVDLWPELALAACEQHNLTPMERHDWKLPHELWYDEDPTPHVARLKIIWSQAFMHIPKARRRRALDAKGSGPLRLIGYGATKKGSYRLYNEETRDVFETRDVSFIEHNHVSLREPTDSGEYHVEKICLDRTDRDGRKQYLVKWAGWDEPMWERADYLADTKALEDYLALKQSEDVTDIDELVLYMCHTSEDSPTWSQAMRSEDAELWREALEKEYDAMKRHQVWETIDASQIPKGAVILDSMPLAKIKRNPDGTIAKYKARLVARGDKQTESSYDETFAPVTKHTTLRIVVATASAEGMELHQMDVKTAFLHGDLDRPIYLRLPPDAKGERKIVLLRKSLYGLKQSPRLWNKNLDTYLVSEGFRASEYDPALYLKHDEKGLVAMVAVYVDDLTIATRDMTIMNTIKDNLSRRYEMEDMGELKYILGIAVERDKENRTVTLSQAKYIDDMMKRYQLTEGRTYNTPLDSNVTMQYSDTDTPVDTHEYQSIVGSLMHLMVCTRPDLAFAVARLSQFQSKPQSTHRTQAIRTLLYAKATRDYKLTYGAKKELVGYADANFATDSKCQMGVLFMLNGGAVVWQSRKQTFTALSTCEAEYGALAEAARECVWLRWLISDIRGTTMSGPITINEDNMAAIRLVKNPVQHNRTKHIDRRYHFTRDEVEKGTIFVNYCPTKEMIADALTKALPFPALETLRNAMGVRRAIGPLQSKA